MTLEEVQAVVRLETANYLDLVNDPRINLKDALVSPQKITVIIRNVKNGKLLKDQEECVWLAGRENANDGYRIIMREKDNQFGLASPGFAHDKRLILTGWYGTLRSAFLGM